MNNTKAESSIRDGMLAVVICTHNPRAEWISRAVDSLKDQTLPVRSWSLTIIDNASTNGVPQELNLSWHPNATIIQEPTLGIGPARRTAIQHVLSADSEFLLFLDDDNILEPGYLEKGLEKGVRDPKLVMWGGNINPEYEQKPETWLRPYLVYLAIYNCQESIVLDRFDGNTDHLPPTAGAFLRTAFLRRYEADPVHRPLRECLGRRGGTLIGGEDTHLAFFALDSGYKVARFSDIRMTHIMPASRLTLGYFEKLLEGVVASSMLLEYMRSGILPSAPSLLQRLRQKWQLWRLPERNRRLFAAEIRGRTFARALISAYHHGGGLEKLDQVIAHYLQCSRK